MSIIIIISSQIQSALHFSELLCISLHFFVFICISLDSIAVSLFTIITFITTITIIHHYSLLSLLFTIIIVRYIIVVVVVVVVIVPCPWPPLAFWTNLTPLYMQYPYSNFSPLSKPRSFTCYLSKSGLKSGALHLGIGAFHKTTAHWFEIYLKKVYLLHWN